MTKPGPKPSTEICDEPGCEELVRSKGKCQKHYQREYRRNKSYEGECQGAEGCDHPIRYPLLGLCGMHYQQREAEKRRGPLAESLTCAECGKSFVPKSRAHKLYCERECSRKAANRTFTEKLGGKRARTLWCNYRLTLEAYYALLESQDGCCAICGTDDPGYPDAGADGWYVDHDHACCPTGGRCCGECVRGLLCHNCNMILGHARDKLDNLYAAIAYLERFL